LILFDNADYFNSCKYPLCGFKLFKPSINSNPTLYVSVVLFNTIIKAFTPSNFDVFIPEIISINRSNSSEVRTTFININNPSDPDYNEVVCSVSDDFSDQPFINYDKNQYIWETRGKTAEKGLSDYL